jgi:two-component system, LuxR family, response regulator FixJ
LVLRLEGFVAERQEDTVIFVVDDDAAVRDSLKLLLEIHGMYVEDFESTQEFVDSYRKHPRECLVLDQHLPMVSGLDFLSSARGAELDLPVILITGRGDDAIRSRAQQLGVAAYLDKPVTDTQLLGAINDALAGGRRAAH